MLTSFSVLFAAYKGDLPYYMEGARQIDAMNENSHVLIAECCTHAPLSEDIGRVKIPNLLRKKYGKDMDIQVVSGADFPDDLTPYDLIVHCGGCMLTEREVKYRMKCTVDQGVPFINYGIIIAYMHGILKRSIRIFPDLLKELEK